MGIALRMPLVLFTTAELERVSNENPGYRFESEEDGTILVSPTHTKGGAKTGEAFVQLYLFAKGAGGKAFDANTGFAIGPAARVYSPDASWVSAPRIAALADNDGGFWPISPDVVIEVRSDNDVFAATVTKIEQFIARGSTYAVAIDPQIREVVQRGVAPQDLSLNFDAIIDAKGNV